MFSLWLFVAVAAAVQVPPPGGERFSDVDSSLALFVGGSTAALDALGAEFSDDLEDDGGFASAATPPRRRKAKLNAMTGRRLA